MWYDMLLTYSNWVSSRWQWSVDLYKNRKETAQNEKQYTKQYKKHKGTEYTKEKPKIRNIEHTYKEYYKTSVE